MAHPSYSRFPFRLLCKRNKYLFIKHKLNDCLIKGIGFSSAVCLPESNLISFKDSFSLLGRKSKLSYSSNLTKPISQVDVIGSAIRSGNFSVGALNNLKFQVLSIGGQINEANFDAIFVGLCSNEKAFSVGKNFFINLHSQGKCNLATIGKYFRLCFDCANECNEDDKKLIIDLSHDILSKYSILDSRTCENMVLGLSITNKWKMGLELLEMSKFSAVPSTKMYSVLIESAFCNKEFDVGWNLLHEMVINNKRPDTSIFKTLLEASFTPESYNKILNFLETYDIHPTEDLATYLLNAFRRVKNKIHHCRVTSINSSGICQGCFKQLQEVVITEEEFLKLRDAFLKPVLLGEDAFLRTKPQEFQSFLDFLADAGKVDVVLDGLNIAYAKDHQQLNKSSAAQMLCDVVRHFVGQSKKVILIGRKHLEQWPKEKMNYIKRNSRIFLAENVSQDDPLLLYAAMKSGLGTFFVSRDQMRGHKFLLRNAELMSIFSRWQQKHQLYFQYVTARGSVKLAEPLPYLLSVQKTSQSSWHIPISSPMDGVPAHLVVRKTKWMCLS